MWTVLPRVLCMGPLPALAALGHYAHTTSPVGVVCAKCGVQTCARSSDPAALSRNLSNW